MNSSRIAIVAAWTEDPWGGSEELWSRASIHLVEEGIRVAACIHGRQPLHPRIEHLVSRGIDVWHRQSFYPLTKRIWRRLRTDRRSIEVVETDRFLESVR